jgi:hypothetical protein
MAIPGRLFWLRLFAALLGLIAFAGGATALFTIDNSAGSVFLLTLGLSLLLVALLGGRIQIESFGILGTSIKVPDVVNSRLRLAQLSDSPGAAERAALLGEQALTLQRLIRLYDLYGYIRRNEPASDHRTRDLDQVVARMQETGRAASFNPAEVSTWFHEGDDALRVVALNLMLARPEYEDFLAVLNALDEPRSLFEQYYGLTLGREMLPRLDRVERDVLRKTIMRAQQKRRFRRDLALVNLGEATLRQLET